MCNILFQATSVIIWNYPHSHSTFLDQCITLHSAVTHIHTHTHIHTLVSHTHLAGCHLVNASVSCEHTVLYTRRGTVEKHSPPTLIKRVFKSLESCSVIHVPEIPLKLLNMHRM